MLIHHHYLIPHLNLNPQLIHSPPPPVEADRKAVVAVLGLSLPVDGLALPLDCPELSPSGQVDVAREPPVGGAHRRNDIDIEYIVHKSCTCPVYIDIEDVRDGKR